MLQQKRHLCLFAVAFVFGTVLYCRKGAVWLPILIALGAVLAVGVMTGRRRRERRIVAGIVLALLVAAFALCGGQEHSYGQIQELIETNPGRELSGTVYKKEIRSDRCLYYLHTSYQKVIVYDDTDEVSIGSDVTVCGTWQAFSHATNEGAFDYAEDYREQKISFRVFADEITVEREPHFSFREGLYRLQQRISAVFSDSLSAREAGVLAQITVGNKGLMDSEVRALYQEAGISHILAISGLHISILGFGVYRFLRRLHLPHHLCEGVGCGIVLCFVMMSGMGTSAIRALVMYLLLMGSYACGRTYDSLNALAFAALVLLVPNPMNLYRSGFQFSFLAMAAIVLWSEITRRAAERKEARLRMAGETSAERRAGQSVVPTAEKKERRLTKIGAELKSRLLFGAFLQMTLLPLTAWCYYEVPLYATFLNLVILPLCSALLGFGLGGGVLGIFFPQAAKWLLIPCHLILRFYEGMVTLTNRLPLHSRITGQPSAWTMLAFYAAFLFACWMFLRRSEGFPRSFVQKISFFSSGRFDKTGRRFRTGQYRKWGFVLPLLLLAVILFVPQRQYSRIDFLDVGQGDGICLTVGDGVHLFIDGGSSSESGVGEYELEPFLTYHAVRHVDVWILTHGDADHYSGLLELLESGYRIDRLVLAAAMPHDAAWEELTVAAETNGTEVLYAAAGDEIVLSDATMTCLYPAAEDGDIAETNTESGSFADATAGDEVPSTGGSASTDTNEFSQVWEFSKDGLSVLFTGDIGEDEERLLIERGLLSDEVVLKVAHHGSRYSSCADFLAAVSPEYAVISCGKNNVYGHPAQETLERLTEAGCEILQTPESGQITFYEKRGKWKIRTFLE